MGDRSRPPHKPIPTKLWPINQPYSNQGDGADYVYPACPPPIFLTFRCPWGRGKCVSVTSHEWYRVTAAVFVNTISEQTKKLWSEITALWRSSLCPLTLATLYSCHHVGFLPICLLYLISAKCFCGSLPSLVL